MKFAKVLLLLGSSILLYCPGSTKDCSVSIKNVVSPQPLFLERGSIKIYPFSNTGHMELNTGQKIELFCPSTYWNPSGKSGSQIATCVSETTFEIGSVKYDLTKVNCTNWVSPTVRRTPLNCNGGKIVETGFAVGPTRFVKQLEICFNETLEVTRYVFHMLQPGTKLYHQQNVPRIDFNRAGFFGSKNLKNLYSQETVANTLKGKLGGIDGNYQLYLARGHLAAMTDFVYGTEQRGTLLFLNAAPQFQVFNNGNWKRVEDSTRNFVSRSNLNVNCYTGVYGITTLANNAGSQTELYLYYDNNGIGLIPVPMLFFRVIIEPLTKRGVVLIGVNNPNLTLQQIMKDYILCPDVSNRLTWVTWRKTDIRAGYSYACEVSAFAEKNPYLPTFDVKSLLT